ncbi:MAG: hypothetical protein QXO91_00685 [Desulfurococcaceae archaeon]
MKLTNILDKKNKLLILLALRAKFKGLEPSISDYHRELSKIFNQDLCYNAVRKRLCKLEGQGFLKSDLVKGFAKNDLVDSKGEVKLKRSTRVFKKVYAVNDKNKLLRKFVETLKTFLKNCSKRTFPKFSATTSF